MSKGNTPPHIKAAALALVCPRCAAAPGVRCTALYYNFRERKHVDKRHTRLHVERLDKARRVK